MAKTKQTEQTTNEAVTAEQPAVSKPTGKALSEGQKATYDGLTTKSARIRYLNGIGWSRGQIAKFMDIRYQHVRNVLITPVKEQRQ